MMIVSDALPSAVHLRECHLARLPKILRFGCRKRDLPIE